MNMLNEQIGSDEYFREIFLNLLIPELTEAEKNIEKSSRSTSNPLKIIFSGSPIQLYSL